ncbi:MAG TPA: phosphoribosylglycinamide formyltransferase [Candidatus Limnocylindria bacterium]|nr:phosphoribosylglycinamide formyltransferase [Candidatus Limnocylindria bacterium]
MRVGFLVSGRGSNLAAVLQAIALGELPGVEPVVVISNRDGVSALSVADRYGVPARVLARSAFASRDERDAAIGRALAAGGADLALLAGYDQLLGRSFFDAFGGRTVNIHPSLLPRHGGKGMVGLAVHAAVLAAGDEETGVTIHDVTAELDSGPAIATCRVPVLPGDEAATLAARVLREEHRLLVTTLRRLASLPEPAGPSASMAALPAPARLGGDAQRNPPHA